MAVQESENKMHLTELTTPLQASFTRLREEMMRKLTLLKNNNVLGHIETYARNFQEHELTPASLRQLSDYYQKLEGLDGLLQSQFKDSSTPIIVEGRNKVPSTIRLLRDIVEQSKVKAQEKLATLDEQIKVYIYEKPEDAGRLDVMELDASTLTEVGKLLNMLSVIDATKIFQERILHHREGISRALTQKKSPLYKKTFDFDVDKNGKNLRISVIKETSEAYVVEVIDEQGIPLVRCRSTPEHLDTDTVRKKIAGELVSHECYLKPKDALKALTKVFVPIRQELDTLENVVVAEKPLMVQEREDSLKLLHSPDYLYQAKKALDLCVIGEDHSKLTNYIIATSSRFAKTTGRPQHLFIQGPTGAGKTHTTRSALKLVPEKYVHHVSSISAKSLRYWEGDLWGKILFIEEWTDLSEEAADLLRPKLTGSDIKSMVTVYDENGKRITQAVGPEGIPVFMAGTTRNAIEEELLNRCWVLDIDQSPEQTRKIMEFQSLKNVMGNVRDIKFSAEAKKFQNAYETLSPVRVANPFLPLTTEFLQGNVIDRRHNENFQFFTNTIAQLHQYQRDKITYNGEVFVLGRLADLYIATRILEPFFQASFTGITRDAKLIRDYITDHSNIAVGELYTKMTSDETGMHLKERAEKSFNEHVEELRSANILRVNENGLFYLNTNSRFNLDGTPVVYATLNETVKMLSDIGDVYGMEKYGFKYHSANNGTEEGFAWDEYTETLIDPISGAGIRLAIVDVDGKCGKIRVENFGAQNDITAVLEKL